ncbi:YuzD family protein [Psychrobacillus psychrodurans]|uniref:YuzD family protein n=1 Tax=Psychrobacillus psychrodurans TaxID=126157 RepID=UPI0008ED1F18|nr:YuzD family protein [Psychrobacillus psychrodurans]MCZ8540395.1 YuzD family protein [Psychrobacillus psychrodurans]SFM59066.1 Disulfide oxidoreductase YuzD [Psychrobacillus psychrodurans]
MSFQSLNIEVYGADVVCASCVNAPSSKDTYEWLQAAIDRKFPNHQVTFSYIDIEKPIENERQQLIANRIADDEFFYPLVMVNDEMIGEGYIQLKPVYAALEKYGYTE